MAFVYENDTATDVADWFTRLEAFMIAAGWTVESGSGTQTVVFKSIGEGGARTKLHCRFRQDGKDVYYSVRDDVAGTHTTTEGGYAAPMDAGGGGAASFDYWMIADRDCVSVVFETGGGYTGCYAGIVERFAVTVPDEEYEMVTCAPHIFGAYACGFVLRQHDGAWDELIEDFSYTDSYRINPLENSYMVAGICVKAAGATPNTSIVGQLKHNSGRMNDVPALNALDTIVTGFGGASSWWTVFGTTTQRWALHTGGTLPVGAWEGGFGYTSGVATDINDLNTKFKAFLVSKGWSEVANPSPTWPIDYFLNSPGQLGGDDIWIRWKYDTAQSYWGAWVMDDISMTHHTFYLNIGSGGRLYPADFPLNYFVAGDADCFIHGVEIASVWYWGWYGMFTMYMADPSSIATPYKVGKVGMTTTSDHILRDMLGNWDANLMDWTDLFNFSSPNLLDGTSYIVWPYPKAQLSAATKIPTGQPKYLHRLSGSALAVNDTVTIGSRRYRYLGANIAHRDT